MASQYQGQGFYLQQMAKKCGKKQLKPKKKLLKWWSQQTKLKDIDKNR
jgi:hypothetical protein